MAADLLDTFVLDDSVRLEADVAAWIELRTSGYTYGGLYEQMVDLLYRSLLGRLPDLNESAAGRSVLALGKHPLEMARELAASDEARALALDLQDANIARIARWGAAEDAFTHC